MRPIQLVILLVAFGAAGLAGMVAMRLAATTPEPVVAQAPSAPAMETAEILVTAGSIRMGTPITPETVTWRLWPKEGLAEDYISRTARPDAVTELQGTLARSPFLAGEPIKEGKLVRTDQGFLSAVLPKGMRAVAVRVNAASTAGGFVLPNDRVDIILIKPPKSDGAEPMSETILRNVRVLAIDQVVEDQEQKQNSVVAQDTATLELTPDQAELIIQAQQVGTISLALRSIEDIDTVTEVVGTDGITVIKFGVPTRVTAKDKQ
ncbi:Flp pilus assembly protein CpaB [Chthonobacter rhizosphaerae]|uniref:Flp pilus assembly protein CpaB n=1 Tax=Chthonobacter rhizosphaerae TaxID=2735553 RepID=UPI0015EF9FA4|nr:Flp pilus assembly protein CpaB [Chthonobacter rhizosphaerae]